MFILCLRIYHEIIKDLLESSISYAKHNTFDNRDSDDKQGEGKNDKEYDIGIANTVGMISCKQ